MNTLGIQQMQASLTLLWNFIEYRQQTLKTYKHKLMLQGEQMQQVGK